MKSEEQKRRQEILQKMLWSSINEQEGAVDLETLKKALQYPELDLNIYQSRNGYAHSFFGDVCRQGI